MWLPMERYAQMNASTPGVLPYLYGVGHNGCDYGTYTHSLYHPSLDIGMSIMMTKNAHIWFNGTLVNNGEKLFCRAYRY
jgi:hypothetical protein